MLLYIHGFGSCGSGNIVTELKQLFGAEDVLSPDLPHAPKEAMEVLEQLISSNLVDLLVGSSLGGFYSEWLNQQHQIPCVLINPSTRPDITLTKYIGSVEDWCTGKVFEWTEDLVAQLMPFKRERPDPSEHYLVLLQTGDEILDYRLAAERYKDHQVVIEQGGNHRFESLEKHLDKIAVFRQQ